MKKIITPFLFALLMLANASLYASSTIFLTVSNAWTQPIIVKEGIIARKKQSLYPHDSVTWTMFTGAIDYLEIQYIKNGLWTFIPGCPSGSFWTSLTVVVVPAPWDFNTPTCSIR